MCCAEADAVEAVALCGPDGDLLTGEGSGNAPEAVFEADTWPGGCDAAKDVAAVVLDPGQLGGEGAWRGSVAG